LHVFLISVLPELLALVRQNEVRRVDDGARNVRVGSKLGGAAKVGGAGGAATKANALIGAAGSTAAAAVAATSQNSGSSPSISPSER
jgi:hypothetical protein